MSFNTTNSELFIVETAEPFDDLAIQFVPDEMNNQRSANIQAISVVGRNDDLMHYIGGSETLSFVLDMYGNNDYVIKKINWLKSLTMNDGFQGSFRNVKLIFGDLFKYHVWSIVSVNAKMGQFSKELQWGPARAQVTINLKLDPITNRLIQDVRNGK